MSTDISFIPNESGRSLAGRFGRLPGVLLVSRFYKLCPALKDIRKICILAGRNTDRPVWRTIDDVLQLGNRYCRATLGIKKYVQSAGGEVQG